MKASTQQDYRQRIMKVLMHIQKHLDEELPLETLAGLANFSPYHFHRIFRGMVGESVKSHIRRLRLEWAAGRLKRSKSSVTTIALDAGYETHEAFTRAFKNAFGRPPSRFRRLDGAIPAIQVPCGVHYHPKGDLNAFQPLNTGGVKMKVEIKTLEEMKVAFVRHVGPYNQCAKAWETLCTWMGAQGLLGADTSFIGLCYDDPEVTPPDKIRYDACVTVDKDFKPADEIDVQTIPGGKFAVTTHLGAYEKLNETYAKIMGQWLPHNDKTLRMKPCLEIYLNDPESTEPEDLITDIYIPIEG